MTAETMTSVPRRVIGTLRLDRNVLAEIEQDLLARYQALAIVLLGGLAHGISIVVNQETGSNGLILALLGNVGMWVLFAGLVYVIGTGILPGESTEIVASTSGVYQTLGYAYAPNLVAIAGVIGVLGQIIAVLGLVWMFVCGVVATSVALRVETGRAFVIALIAGVISAIVFSLFGSIIGQPFVG